jgi:polysaccharide export outer membrane protein
MAPPLSAQQVLPPPRDSIPSSSDTLVRNVGVLRPGDELNIVVFRDKELSGKYLIDSRGMLQIAGLGSIRVAGLDPSQVTERLRSALEERGRSAPEIAVQPLIRVSVLGEVQQRGLLSVDPGTSLIQLLTLAGGPTGSANLRKTRVVREGRVHIVDLESALSGSAAGRVVLYSNDIVVVPRRTGWTRENLAFAISAAGALLTIVNVIVTLQRT